MTPIHVTRARSHVKEVLDALALDGWTSFAVEPATFTPPAAIVAGREPYIGAPRTFETRSMALRVVLALRQTSDYAEALAALETATATVILGLEDAGIGVEGTGEPYTLATPAGGLLPALDINITLSITLEGITP